PFIARAQLQPLKNGEFSYHLRLPQRIAIASLSVSAELDGLLIQNDSAAHFQNVDITIDGHTATLVDPTKTSFDSVAPDRGLFRRADLIVNFPLPDSDYDGMADWWEEKYGLNKLLDDAALDPDGDLVTNLSEYRAGSNPNHSDVRPRLAGSPVLTLLSGGSSALVASVTDTDSTSAQIVWTLQALPAGITARVHGLQHNGRALPPGSAFTQADVQAGRVIFTHDGSTALPNDAVLAFSVRDEHPEFASNVEVGISLATSQPDLFAVWNLPLPDMNRVIHDASRSGAATLRASSGPETLTDVRVYQAYIDAVGADLPRLLIGSDQADTLIGSGESDWIAGGPGNDSLRGYAGADRFIIADAAGSDTITDFNSAGGDILDLTQILEPTAGRFLSDYLTVALDTEDTVISVDANGDHLGTADATIRLKGQLLTPDDIEELWDLGAIATGTIIPRATLYVTATDAAEENLVAGKFTLRRRGDAAAPLTLSLTITGTAIAGVDYVALPTTVTFAIGQKTIELPITPLQDDLTENTETIQILLPSAPGYILGSTTASADLTNLPSRVWLEVTERTAYKDSLSPAQILVRRSGSLSSTLTAGLTVTGRATAAVDYKRLPATVSFVAGQDTIAVDVLPLASATLTRGAEEVIVTLKSDPSYLFGPVTKVLTVIVNQPRVLASWRSTQTGGPDDSLDDEQFDNADGDHDGIKGLMEFALNLNATKGDNPPIKLVFDANGKPGLEYRRWPGAPEVDYTVEWTTDLKSWHMATEADSVETVNEIETTGMERTVRSLIVPPATGNVFMRLNVRRR
ncbi:MAG TPA: Calx-beta domain-containing protein, partial [Prosthecobacter sp.]